MHEQFLLLALEQAWLGRGSCAPNPAVGAIAVQNETIIAQASHSGSGSPHAEQLLFSMLPDDCSNITIYVTLEPCNHWGRTPPCVDALIKHRVCRVVYAYRDPNPVVAENNTPALLSAAGIDVVHHPLPEIDAFYASYAHWTKTKLPFVTVKMAQTFDGKIAGEYGQRVTLTNDLCSLFTHKQRLHTDIILTTAVTINQDDPLLNARVEGRIVSKPVAILDRRGSIKPYAKIFETAKQCIIYTNAPLTRCSQFVEKSKLSFYPLPTAPLGFDLFALFCHLGELGYHDVWVEAGAGLFNALHQAGLVQLTYLYFSPVLLGKAATSLYADVTLFNQLKEITWQPMGNNVLAKLVF